MVDDGRIVADGFHRRIVVNLDILDELVDERELAEFREIGDVFLCHIIKIKVPTFQQGLVSCSH